MFAETNMSNSIAQNFFKENDKEKSPCSSVVEHFLGKECSKRKKLSNKTLNEIIEKYLHKNQSVAMLAKEYGVTTQAIHLWLKKLNLSKTRTGKNNVFYRTGKVRPESCSECGFIGKNKAGQSLIQAHHDDYNKPLEVRWLCKKCHFEWHKFNTPIQLRGLP